MNSKDIAKKFEKFRYKYDVYSVFEDFLAFAAITLADFSITEGKDKRLNQYFDIQKKYGKANTLFFTEILAEVIKSLNEKPGDVLGEIYMSLNVSNKHKGQFFTPYQISSASARLVFDKELVNKTINEKGFISLSEPSCGSGGMIVAFYEEFRKYDYSPTQIAVVAQDIDRRCVLMTYIQLSILGIPAKIILGDSLLLEEKEVWFTPLVSDYIIGEKKSA